MAYGNNNQGGGCLGAIAGLVGGIFGWFLGYLGAAAVICLFLLPVFIDEDIGFGGMFIWWCVLAIIIFLIVRAIKKHKKNKEDKEADLHRYSEPSNTDFDNKSDVKNTPPVQSVSIKVDNNNLNNSVTEAYSKKIGLIRKLEKEIENIQSEQRRIADEISNRQKSIDELLTGTEKPIYLSKKKWLAKVQPDIEQIRAEIDLKNQEQSENEEKICMKKETINSIYFNVPSDSNKEFEELKIAFDRIKQSDNVSGSSDLKNSDISEPQWNNDLKHIKYATKPYGFKLEDYRFYIFPNSIWAFEKNGEFLGAYKPCAINCSLETKERINQIHHGIKPEVYSDTKIVKKNVAYKSGLHRRDGSFELNRSAINTYYVEHEYYVDCLLELTLCGCTLNYRISSLDNCELLERAIHAYSLVREYKNIVPIIMDLLKRCSEDSEIDAIMDIVENQYQV